MGNVLGNRTSTCSPHHWRAASQEKGARLQGGARRRKVWEAMGKTLGLSLSRCGTLCGGAVLRLVLHGEHAAGGTIPLVGVLEGKARNT